MGKLWQENNQNFPKKQKMIKSKPEIEEANAIIHTCDAQPREGGGRGYSIVRSGHVKLM